MASRKGLKAVLFDLDGTIVNLNVDWDGLKKALQRHFATYGFELPRRPLLDSLREIEEALLTYFSENMSRKIMEAAFQIMRQFEIEGLKEATVCEGALEVLTWLKAECIPFAIVSNNDSECIWEAVKRFGFPHPDAIVGRDRTRGKPDPWSVERALNLLGINPGSDVWMVGDKDVDMEAGRQFHLKLALVRRAPEKSMAHKALYLSNLLDLLAVWRKQT